MYSTPTVAAPGVTKGAVTGIAASVCTFVVLILLGSTIVLALIPIYTSNRSVPSNSASLTSKEVTMTVDIGKSTATTTGRRRRQATDPGNFVGGEFGPTGKDMVQDKLKNLFKSNTVRGVSVSSVSIGYKDDGTKKRFALLKRATVQRTVVAIIKFNILYALSCFLSCQTIQGPILQTSILNAPISTFAFTNVPIYKNGIFDQTANSISGIGILYVSVIIPGKSPITAGPSPATGSPIANTTTAITTAPNATTLTTAASTTRALG